MPSRPGKVRPKSTPDQLRDSGLLLDPALASGPIDLAAVFANRRPVEVEIGPGKGAFLLRRAEDRPEINLLAVEWVPAYAMYVADRARRAGLPNVRVLYAEAASLFHRCLADRVLIRVHVYFPDPWPKRRHRRRRLLRKPFLEDVRRTLRLGGWLGFVTDHEDYFREARSTLATVDGLAEVRFALDAPEDRLVGSNFEEKYRCAGTSFYALAAIRYR